MLYYSNLINFPVGNYVQIQAKQKNININTAERKHILSAAFFIHSLYFPSYIHYSPHSDSLRQCPL